MTDKLVGVHPLLVGAVGRILHAMDILGYPMVVTDGVRTEQEQAALYAKGRTAPGRIVTNAKGTPDSRSNHQVKADGFGHAVDCCFLIDADRDGEVDDPTWDDARPWALYGAMARALGLKWGGDWPTHKTDRPHVERP